MFPAYPPPPPTPTPVKKKIRLFYKPVCAACYGRPRKQTQLSRRWARHFVRYPPCIPPGGFLRAAAWSWAPECILTEDKACALLPSPSEVVGLSPPQRAEKDPKNTILASPYWTAEATTMKGNSNLRTKPSGFFPEQQMTSACRCSPSWAIPTTASVTRALGRGRLEPRRAKDAEVQEEVGAPRPRPH